MDQIEAVLEKQIAHLRKMIDLIESGDAQIHVQGEDASSELAVDYRGLEAELSNALDRHRIRISAGLPPSH